MWVTVCQIVTHSCFLLGHSDIWLAADAKRGIGVISVGRQLTSLCAWGVVVRILHNLIFLYKLINNKTLVTEYTISVPSAKAQNPSSKKFVFFLAFLSPCTTLPGGEDRLRLGNAQINLAFRSTCTIVPSLRSGKIGCGSGMLKQKICFFLGIPLTLHYLCH